MQPISAILVHDQEYPLSGLNAVLENQAVKTRRVRTCGEASELLQQATSPQVVFTDVDLPDGTWADVLNVAAAIPVPVNVIVVARLVDVRFYVEVIERGAFDFITPPFTARDVSHILRCASDGAVQRAYLRAGAA